MSRPCVTTTPRSTTTVSPSDLAEVLSSLVAPLEAMDRRLRVIECWVNEWESSEVLIDEYITINRDKSRDH